MHVYDLSLLQCTTFFGTRITMHVEPSSPPFASNIPQLLFVSRVKVMAMRVDATVFFDLVLDTEEDGGEESG